MNIYMFIHFICLFIYTNLLIGSFINFIIYTFINMYGGRFQMSFGGLKPIAFDLKCLVYGVCCCRHNCHICGTRSRGGVCVSADTSCGIQKGCGTKINAEPNTVAEPNAVAEPKMINICINK